MPEIQGNLMLNYLFSFSSSLQTWPKFSIFTEQANERRLVRGETCGRSLDNLNFMCWIYDSAGKRHSELQDQKSHTNGKWLCQPTNLQPAVSIYICGKINVNNQINSPTPAGRSWIIKNYYTCSTSYTDNSTTKIIIGRDFYPISNQHLINTWHIS